MQQDWLVDAAAPREAEAHAAQEEVRCLCGAGSDSAVLTAQDPEARGIWTYRRCAACGLERLSPRPHIEHMGQHYPDDYSPYCDPAPQTASRADRLKRLAYETFFALPEERSDTARRYRPLLRLALWPLRNHSVLSFHPPATRRVFELGAGSGADLLEFRAAGWEVLGCEPSAVGCAAAARHGITLQQTTAEAAELPDGLSCVYMNNVFEHLHDPPAVLAKARASLVPGGLVVLVVPNHASWAARLFGRTWPGYDPPRHIWGFTPESVRGVLERAGFEAVSVVQKYPLSTFCWHAGIDGYRVDEVPNRRARQVLARVLGRGVILGGMLAAAFGSADFMRVVARKPG